ncbi:MAG: TIGR04283 family arsenosugar biosynthesis glycosyltransferase [Rhodospirillales bacterium]|nr:TIGR04283 family arsenosugar biosynthesis glycosyltransferase [Rhodospirillales bacterium]
MTPLTIVIPTLDAASALGRVLDDIGAGACGSDVEVVVADGGSTDATRVIAQDHGAKVVVAPRGRGRQLAAGAEAGAGDWFLFLHADTHLPANWRTVVGDFAADPINGHRAGYFRFALDDNSVWARRLQDLVLWRSIYLGLPYGDQGLLISRDLYMHLGGYKRIPLMEDVDLVRRIGRRRLVLLGATAVTSAERYRRDGYLWRVLRNAFCLGLYTVGVPPGVVAGIYR